MNRFVSTSAGRALTALLALFCAGVAAAAPAALVAFSSGPRDGWQVLAGDKQNWAVPVTDDFATQNEVVRVQVEADGAHRISWRGRAEGQYFVAGDATDVSPLLEASAGLVVVLQIHEAPSRAVSLRMGCGYPCAANADITRLLRALPVDQWVRVSVDLQCFADNGLDAGNVDMPFMLHTRGRMEVSVGEVRIEAGAGEAATIRC